MGKRPSQLWKKYLVKGDGVESRAVFCPLCGKGYILAEHSDRHTCGRCGYTSFKKK
ncbi:MAG: 30S ribosomal protein S27ae [Nitrososphaerota archaeon]|nr:30S ribosomal protein S27ae [Nitrososphaerota archaeon]